MYKPVLLFLFLIFISSCSNDVSRKKVEEVVEHPTPIRVSVVEPQPFRVYTTVTSYLEAKEDITFSSLLGGKVEYAADRTSRQINKGDVLAEINGTIYKNDFDVAEFNLNTSTKQYNRQKSLYKKGLISDQAFENSEQSFKSAESQFKKARFNLENSVIRAPFSGYITDVFVEESEFINPGTPVLNFIDTSEFKLTAYVTQQHIFSINIGDHVDVDIPALNETVKGTVSYVGIKTDSVSKTYPIDIRISDRVSQLKHGLLVNVKLPIQSFGSTIVVRQDKILESDDKHWVMLEKEGRASQVQVTLGAEYDNYVQIIDGVSIGDHLIIDGHGSLKQNDLVKIVNE